MKPSSQSLIFTHTPTSLAIAVAFVLVILIIYLFFRDWLIALRPLIDIDAEARRADALFLCAVTPTLLTALHRLRLGRQPVPPRDDLGYAANWLYMATGVEPSAAHARAVEHYLEHGGARPYLRELLVLLQEWKQQGRINEVDGAIEFGRANRSRLARTRRRHRPDELVAVDARGDETRPVVEQRWKGIPRRHRPDAHCPDRARQ